MRIAQLVPGVHPHDAVSNDSLRMTAALRAAGHEVAMFAWLVKGVDEPVLEPTAIESWIRSSDDVVIYHYCTGLDYPVDFLARTRARRVVRYHNVTPPGFFRGWSPGFVASCEAGRAQLPRLARLGCELYLGCSDYNNADFIAAGVDPGRCAVLPPLHACGDILRSKPDFARIPRTFGAPLLLMVGRIAPNKGYLELLDAVAACRQGVHPETRLLAFGKLDPNLASYGSAVQARIDALGLRDHVTIIGDAGDAELRAGFEAATAMVMPSAHEGFCVPLLEAMALGTPVIAYGSSAIPETLGDAGLVWESRDAALIAASVAHVHRNAQLRAGLRERGRARYDAHFAPEVLERSLIDIIGRFR